MRGGMGEKFYEFSLPELYQVLTVNTGEKSPGASHRGKGEKSV